MLKLTNKILPKSVKSLIAISIATVSLGISANLDAHDGNQVLAGIVLDREAEQRARDVYRRPVQTLSFFHIEPGMKVAEALPGGGWYTRILAPYLGSEGEIYGINYNDDMWPLFGFFTPERMQSMIDRTSAFPGLVSDITDNGIKTGGFTFASAPEELNGTLDRVLFIRALHNLGRFEGEAGTMTQALQAAFDLLKPNGLVGVVQHRAPASAKPDWADGSRGYLKQLDVVKAFQNAGFELVAASEMNANPKDKPGAEDIVWRLPPSFNGAGDDQAKRDALQAIGESDRMTLLFKKQGASFSH